MGHKLLYLASLSWCDSTLGYHKISEKKSGNSDSHPPAISVLKRDQVSRALILSTLLPRSALLYISFDCTRAEMSITVKSAGNVYIVR